MAPRKNITVVLASASPRRKDLLARLAITPTIIPANIDEKELPGETSIELVQRLASEKASHVYAQLAEHDKTLVIGADTIVDLDGQVLGKPTDANHAEEMLFALQGRSHTVYSGVAICYQQQTFAAYAETKVTMRSATRNELRNYVALGESFDKAGACCAQGFGGLWIDHFEGSYQNVLGLPLQTLDTLCHTVGLPLLSLTDATNVNDFEAEIS